MRKQDRIARDQEQKRSEQGTKSGTPPQRPEREQMSARESADQLPEPLHSPSKPLPLPE
jgi:hypothetical protein